MFPSPWLIVRPSIPYILYISVLSLYALLLHFHSQPCLCYFCTNWQQTHFAASQHLYLSLFSVCLLANTRISSYVLFLSVPIWSSFYVSLFLGLPFFFFSCEVRKSDQGLLIWGGFWDFIYSSEVMEGFCDLQVDVNGEETFMVNKASLLPILRPSFLRFCCQYLSFAWLLKLHLPFLPLWFSLLGLAFALANEVAPLCCLFPKFSLLFFVKDLKYCSKFHLSNLLVLLCVCVKLQLLKIDRNDYSSMIYTFFCKLYLYTSNSYYPQ